MAGAARVRRVSLWSADAAGHRNMLLLVQLRWLAVGGQVLTIAVAELGMGVHLPLLPMLLMVAALVVLNAASLGMLRLRRAVANTELFLAVLVDIASLSFQLYQSGGATNPFVSLFLLQVVLGAVLLDTWSSWAIVVLTSLCFAGLTVAYRPLELPARYDPYALHIAGTWVAFVLVALLLVAFVTRIARNLRARDAHLADLRQRAAEEDHIVRMGLLASGAAHELGTPLASLAVILGDWRRMPALAADPELTAEIAEMQAEVGRCKAIVTGILLSAGEARGEAPVSTTVRQFLDDVAGGWSSARGFPLTREDRFGADVAIVADPALRQVIWTVLDNAAEVSPHWIGFAAGRDGDMLLLTVRDHGLGFPAQFLTDLGKPYMSSKGTGRGLGLFLVVNVLRQLGGRVEARNAGGGAVVTLALPIAALALPEKEENLD
ncbi:MAG TPA: ATP-binding protein [Sphingomonas sp.]